jgi:hypothetical protein
VAISADGKRIVSGGEDNTVKVWDAFTGRDLLTLKGHTESVISVVISADCKRIVSRDESGKILVWDAANGRRLSDSPIERSPESASVAVSGNIRVRADGPLLRIERIISEEERWQRRMEEEPSERFLRFRDSKDYHAAEAETAELNHQPFAAVFHLDRLLPLLPEQRRELLARRRAVLTTELKKTPGDIWAARALARQAVGDPGSLSDRETLLSFRAALSTQQDAPHDRSYGALLLRTDSPREAILVLRAAIQNRDPDAPPVEELLLALAHLQRDQTAEARKYLQIAVAWMRQGTMPVRAAEVVGLATTGPLSALGRLVVRPPDPRLESLDPQTAYELNTLREEVERALAKAKR